MDKDLLKQLKSLNKIQPSTEWKNSAREDILAKIMGEDSPQKMNLWAEFLYFIKFFSGIFNDFIMKPVGTMVLVFLLVLGGGILKVRADNSLPGDLLYSLKRGSEKMEVALIFNDEKRVEARLKIMDERAREINEIISRMKKDRDVNTRKALASFHEDFRSIANNLLSDENKENSLRIAKNIEDKTGELQFILTRAQDKSTKDLKNDLGKAIDDVNKVNLNALSVLASSDDSGVAQKIDDKIDQSTKKLKEMKNLSSDALAKLDEAKEELENKNFVVALEKIKESNEIIDNNKATSTPTISNKATITPINDIGKVKGEATSTLWLNNATSSCDDLNCSSTPDRQ